jgi:adenylate cyclase
MREQWEAEGKTPLAARIGLNTGTVIVGAMGSSVRLAYTALGDPMNLGKRLESLNNLYGTRILASDATVRAAGDSILTRPVDLVAVVGRVEPILVHEVMGVRGEMSLSDERLAERTARAMEYYRARRWPEAIAALEEVLIQRPNDGPARLLLESCRDYSVTPPGREWDGVRRMLKK